MIDFTLFSVKHFCHRTKLCAIFLLTEFFHNRAGKGKGREIYAPIEPDGEINAY